MRKYLLDLLWIASCIGLSWNIFSLSHNTLEHNAKWNSTKTSLGKEVNGAFSFFHETQALANNALHLDSWHGFQEVTTKQKFIPSELDFTVSFDPDSYIYAQIDHAQDYFSAFRLSVNKNFPSAYIVGNAHGQFLSIDSFEGGFAPKKEYHVKITIVDNRSAIALYVDGKLLKKTPYDNHSTASPIGLRGSFYGTQIKNVHVIGENEKVLFHDRFAYSDTRYGIFFILSGVAVYIVWQVIVSQLNNKAHISRFALPSFQIIAVSLLVVFSLMNRYFYDKYPRIDGLFSWYWKEKEVTWKKWSIEEKTGLVQSLKPKKAYRIAFIGGSQTWGAGAVSESGTFVAEIEEVLNNKSLMSREIESVNVAVSGIDSTGLLDAYKTRWKEKLDPDMLVVNMSNNDDDVKQFAANLKEFVSINGTGTKTVFVLEANSPEVGTDIAEKHTVMKKVAEELDVPTIDLHSYLSSQNNTGILWWDKVHLTSYGHFLSAHYLSKHIEIILQNEKKELLK